MKLELTIAQILLYRLMLRKSYLHDSFFFFTGVIDGLCDLQ